MIIEVLIPSSLSFYKYLIFFCHFHIIRPEKNKRMLKYGGRNECRKARNYVPSTWNIPMKKKAKKDIEQEMDTH
jgi:hypothetical protein